MDNKSNQVGFTLVEMMVVVALVVVVMFSAPSFVNMIKSNEQTSAANSLLFALTNARDESVTRNAPVTVCQSDDGETCSDGGWQDGWIVFTDDDTRGTVDGTDAVLQAFPVISDDTSLSSTNFPTFATFLSDGTSASSGTFALCDDRGAAHALSICIEPTGRVDVRSDNCAGSAIVCPDDEEA